MGDHADNADPYINATIQAGIAQARRTQQLVPDGRCHFCDEEVPIGMTFCDKDCRDDFDHEQAALRRSGRPV